MKVLNMRIKRCGEEEEMKAGNKNFLRKKYNLMKLNSLFKVILLIVVKKQLA